MRQECSIGVMIVAPAVAGVEEILTNEALHFIAELYRTFGRRREALLAGRIARQKKIDAGETLNFLTETESVRQAEWKIAPVPADLLDRRVEITGPASSAKMVINALNSGAKVFMADAEDSESPTWPNIIKGQVNLREAVRGAICWTSPEGKKYALGEKTAVLVFRQRGLHLLERHVLVDGRPIPAALFDFGLFFFHNARALLEKGSGPYFYLPKMENHLEARWWNEVFRFAEFFLSLPYGTIKATALIETLPAAFEMDEILHELREHSAGLNCGRWDYIFSFIKTFRNQSKSVLPDRASLTMDKGFLAAYVDLLIKTCHRRGTHAMGGMAAQIPIKNDPAANEAALAKVRADKTREVLAGHDGTWVAHPGLVPVAKEIFDQHLPGPNQLSRTLDAGLVTIKSLSQIPQGEITEAGLRTNVSVGLQYLTAWLSGAGCVPINNLMEDAATAEICRTQLWQWVKHGARISDGGLVTANLVRDILQQELAKIKTGKENDSTARYQLASELFQKMVTADECADFLTLEAYQHL